MRVRVWGGDTHTVRMRRLQMGVASVRPEDGDWVGTCVCACMVRQVVDMSTAGPTAEELETVVRLEQLQYDSNQVRNGWLQLAQPAAHDA